MRALVFSIDDSYVMPFQVLFHSLHKTGSLAEHPPLFILHEEGLCAESKSSLSEFAGNLGHKLNFLDAAKSVPDDLPFLETDHVGKATFYRLFVDEIMPADITSIVYMDSDAVVIRSLRELFSTELQAPIAAVDHFTPSNEFRLHGAKGGTYFQAGILLIDLDAWREHKLSKAFLKIIREERDKIKWWDQDVLNIAFADNWQRLSVWDNVCQNVMASVPHDLIKDNARFIHFDGSHKPWINGDNRPFQDMWFQAYEAAFDCTFVKPDENSAQAGICARIVQAIASRFN